MPARIDRGASERPTLGVAVAVATAAVLPVFLTGGLAVQMRADLGFGRGSLGVAVSAFFLTSALASAVLGRVVERMGARRGMRAATGLSALSLLGIGALAHSWPVLVGFLVVGGLGNAAANPATHLLLATAIRRRRQGLAFGVKQAAIPAATLLGGLATPLVAISVGWRWGFVGAAALTAGVALALARASDAGRVRTRTAPRLPRAAPLLLPAVGVGLGSASAVSLGAFLVDAAVDAGMREAAAGLLLALGSAAGVGARVLAGWAADRHAASGLHSVAAMLALGATGFAMLATGQVGWPLVLGTVLGFAAGWGWPGVFNFAIVREYREAPAAATGITQTGAYTGSAAGPLAFGLVAQHGSYTVAWLGSTVLALASAAAMLVGARALARSGGQRGHAPGDEHDREREPPERLLGQSRPEGGSDVVAQQRAGKPEQGGGHQGLRLERVLRGQEDERDRVGDDEVHREVGQERERRGLVAGEQEHGRDAVQRRGRAEEASGEARGEGRSRDRRRWGSVGRACEQEGGDHHEKAGRQLDRRGLDTGHDQGAGVEPRHAAGDQKTAAPAADVLAEAVGERDARHEGEREVRRNDEPQGKAQEQQQRRRHERVAEAGGAAEERGREHRHAAKDEVEEVRVADRGFPLFSFTRPWVVGRLPGVPAGWVASGPAAARREAR